jgi:hypothetical protein
MDYQSLRKGDLEDIGLVEIDSDQFHFQVISDAGKTIDSGTVVRNRQLNAPANAPPDTVTVPKSPAKKSRAI